MLAIRRLDGLAAEVFDVRTSLHSKASQLSALGAKLSSSRGYSPLKQKESKLTSGSVIAKQIRFLPLRMSGTTRF